MLRARPLACALAAVSLSAFAQGTAPEKFKLIHVDDLVALQQKKTAFFLFDANDAAYRGKNGIIPGARQLSSYDRFDIPHELPPDRGSKLVFYCANKR